MLSVLCVILGVLMMMMIMVWVHARTTCITCFFFDDGGGCTALFLQRTAQTAAGWTGCGLGFQ